MRDFFRKRWWVFLVLSIIFLLPIIAYIINFHNGEISDKSADWGTFGDFVGGTLNPFISILSLTVTVFIAFYLRTIEDNWNQDSIILQQRLNKTNAELQRKIALSNLRQIEYGRISELMARLNELSTEKTVSNLAKLRNNLKYFCTVNRNLFPNVFEGEDYKSLFLLINEMKEFASSNEFKTPEGRQKMGKLMGKYQRCCYNILSNMEHLIVSELDGNYKKTNSIKVAVEK
jgi:hypothetical protein